MGDHSLMYEDNFWGKNDIVYTWKKWMTMIFQSFRSWCRMNKQNCRFGWCLSEDPSAYVFDLLFSSSCLQKSSKNASLSHSAARVAYRCSHCRVLSFPDVTSFYRMWRHFMVTTHHTRTNVLICALLLISNFSLASLSQKWEQTHRLSHTTHPQISMFRWSYKIAVSRMILPG